jgi:hypothetical protein
VAGVPLLPAVAALNPAGDSRGPATDHVPAAAADEAQLVGRIQRR